MVSFVCTVACRYGAAQASQAERRRRENIEEDSGEESCRATDKAVPLIDLAVFLNVIFGAMPRTITDSRAWYIYE